MIKFWEYGKKSFDFWKEFDPNNGNIIYLKGGYLGKSRFVSLVSVWSGRIPAFESPELLSINGETGTGFGGNLVVGNRLKVSCIWTFGARVVIGTWGAAVVWIRLGSTAWFPTITCGAAVTGACWSCCSCWGSWNWGTGRGTWAAGCCT